MFAIVFRPQCYVSVPVEEFAQGDHIFEGIVTPKVQGIDAASVKTK
jgi:hypothetical protein